MATAQCHELPGNDRRCLTSWSSESYVNAGEVINGLCTCVLPLLEETHSCLIVQLYAVKWVIVQALPAAANVPFIGGFIEGALQ